MTSRPLTRPRAQIRPQSDGDSTTGQPHGAITGLQQARTGPPQAPARPQVGEDSRTGQPRGALTGLVRDRPLAGEEA